MPRQFTEEEAQRVFARLAELQGQGHGDDRTLSIDELKEAARAAGLDPSLVERAVRDVEAPPERRRTLFGAPVEVVQTRVVPGTLTDDVWAQMVAALRTEFDAVGMAGELGRTREWTHISGGTKNGITTRLSAEPTAGGTRLTLSRSVRDSVLGFSIAGGIQLLMAVLFFALPILGGEPDLWIPGAMMLAFGLVFTVGTQVGTRVWAQRRSEQFDRALGRLELISRAAAPVDAEQTGAEPPSTEPADAEQASPLLDLDADPEDGMEGDGWTVPRRRRRSR